MFQNKISRNTKKARKSGRVTAKAHFAEPDPDTRTTTGMAMLALWLCICLIRILDGMSLSLGNQAGSSASTD